MTTTRTTHTALAVSVTEEPGWTIETTPPEDPTFLVDGQHYHLTAPDGREVGFAQDVYLIEDARHEVEAEVYLRRLPTDIEDEDFLSTATDLLTDVVRGQHGNPGDDYHMTVAVYGPDDYRSIQRCAAIDPSVTLQAVIERSRPQAVH